MKRFRSPLKAALLLGSCALLAAALLAGVHEATRAPIAEAERRAELAALSVVLPPSQYDNDPFADSIRVIAPRWLGSGQPLTVRRGRQGGRPSALVLDAVADGYAGPIRLLVGIDAGGGILGVRVTRHQETPGLGDWIERDKSDWIEGFDGRSLGEPPLADWKVRKDGGVFDQFAGATITPRAVVAALRRALQYVRAHGDDLYTAPQGTLLRHDDAPEPQDDP